MSWLEQTLEDFGKSLGLPGLAWTTDNVVTLEFQRSGRLSILRGGRVVGLALMRDYSHITAQQIQVALELCHWSNRHPLPVRTGLIHDGQLVFSTQVSHSDFIVSNVQRALDLLCRLHDEVEARRGEFAFGFHQFSLR